MTNMRCHGMNDTPCRLHRPLRLRTYVSFATVPKVLFVAGFGWARIDLRAVAPSD
jgi:hypothetical protein